MALHLTPEEHDSDPPSGWTVRKSGRQWQLVSRNGGIIETFKTKAKAEQAKSSGWIFDLYQREGRWFRGESVPGWRPYTGRPIFT